MVKDLKYFIEEEKNFCDEHPDYGNLFFDESIGAINEKGSEDRLFYLSCRIFCENLEELKTPLGNEDEFGLTNAQKLLLRLYIGRYSNIFRDDFYYNHINDFVQNLFDTLDDIVKKAPICNDTLLYRFCNEYDRKDMEVDEVITIPHNLTCTNYNWEQEHIKNVYVITPLKNGKTRAHNLYEIYKHGDENQVDFLRNTKFLVRKIENTEGTLFKKFFLEEIE